MKRRFSSREMARRHKLRKVREAGKIKPLRNKIGFINQMVICHNVTETQVRIFHAMSKDKKITERLCQQMDMGHEFPANLEELVNMIRIIRTAPSLLSKNTTEAIAAALFELSKAGVTAAAAGRALSYAMNKIAMGVAEDVVKEFFNKENQHGTKI